MWIELYDKNHRVKDMKSVAQSPVILGVKNREELKQCVDAEAAGPLEPALMARIDGLGLRD